MTDNPFIPDYDDPPPAPPTVYKYLSPERLDVLKNGCIRFTPLLGTNDLFEVRQTFERIAGPLFSAALRHEADIIEAPAIDSMIVEELEKLGLSRQSASLLGPAAARNFLGSNYPDAIRAQTKLFADVVVEKMNTPGGADTLLDRLGGSLLALSLAEVPDSAVMWAHYARNSTGFVIAFDTSAALFRAGKGGKSRALHKITYFDGKVEEIMEDPRACLISKMADWSYEREWRLYIKREDADRIIKSENEDIHLVDFPAPAVCRVIAGVRAAPDLVRSLREVLIAQYPHATLATMRPDRRSATLTEVAIR